MIRLLAVAVLIALSAMGLAWTADSGQFFHLDDPKVPTDWITLVVLAFATIAGLFCGSLFGRLKSQPGDVIDWRELFRTFLVHKKSVMAMLVSPIIYFSILKIVGQSVDNIADVLLAFQNGFFWESVFATLVAEKID